MRKSPRCAVAIFIALLTLFMQAGCIIGTKDDDSVDYPERWELAILDTDEFGSSLVVVRENGDAWQLESKTFCFWARNYVGKTVWLKWGPVQTLIMNDNGETCEMWTRGRINESEQ